LLIDIASFLLEFPFLQGVSRLFCPNHREHGIVTGEGRSPFSEPANPIEQISLSYPRVTVLHSFQKSVNEKSDRHPQDHLKDGG
jgi:hypothetical protein